MNKKYILLFILLALPMLSGTRAHADVNSVVVKPDAIFAPQGFDSNDNVQIVLYGKYHDVCHKLAPATVTVDRANLKITIQDNAYQTSDLCDAMFVSVPYTSVLNLGILPKGQYQVMATDQAGQAFITRTLPVAQAFTANQVDDHLYAKVDDVQVTKTSDPSVLQVTLKGTLNNTCLSIKEVRTNLTADNVYDILPIMSKASANCQESNTPFENIVILNHFPSAPTLLNIRTLGGQSIEKVIDTQTLL